MSRIVIVILIFHSQKNIDLIVMKQVVSIVLNLSIPYPTESHALTDACNAYNDLISWPYNTISSALSLKHT
jgi:hypothetical protein